MVAAEVGVVNREDSGPGGYGSGVADSAPFLLLAISTARHISRSRIALDCRKL